MNNPKFRNVLFDLDGTLVDSVEDIVCCLKKAYDEVPGFSGVRIDKSYLGPPLGDVIRNITPAIEEKHAQLVMKEFMRCYDTSPLSGTRLYEGAYELIQNLREHGVKLFVVTNKRSFAARRILTKLGVDVFDDVVTPDTIAGKRMDKEDMISYLIEKHGLEKAVTVMVSDSPSDIIAARKDGICSVAVLEGYGDAEGLYKSKPSYVIEKIGDLASTCIDDGSR
jgi:phosphoglycolate phosphatase